MTGVQRCALPLYKRKASEVHWCQNTIPSPWSLSLESNHPNSQVKQAETRHVFKRMDKIFSLITILLKEKIITGYGFMIPWVAVFIHRCAQPLTKIPNTHPMWSFFRILHQTKLLFVATLILLPPGLKCGTFAVEKFPLNLFQ